MGLKRSLLGLITSHVVPIWCRRTCDPCLVLRRGGLLEGGYFRKFVRFEVQSKVKAKKTTQTEMFGENIHIRVIIFDEIGLYGL